MRPFTDCVIADTSVNKTYSEGSRVNISATPKSGYQFDKWSDGNTSASRTVTMNANTTLVASFKAVSSGGSTEPGGEGDEDNPDFLYPRPLSNPRL